MKKFLKAVRLDNSDAELYQQGGACDEDEWVTSGGFAVCDLAQGYRCEPRCYCDASFMSLTRRARCTIAEVIEIEDVDLEIFKDQMAQHLLFDWKAPDFDTARGVAEEEITIRPNSLRPFRLRCGSRSIVHRQATARLMKNTINTNV